MSEVTPPTDLVMVAIWQWAQDHGWPLAQPPDWLPDEVHMANSKGFITLFYGTPALAQGPITDGCNTDDDADDDKYDLCYTMGLMDQDGPFPDGQYHGRLDPTNPKLLDHIQALVDKLA